MTLADLGVAGLVNFVPASAYQFCLPYLQHSRNLGPAFKPSPVDLVLHIETAHQLQRAHDDGRGGEIKGERGLNATSLPSLATVAPSQ